MTRRNEESRYWKTVDTFNEGGKLYAVQQKEVLLYLYGSGAATGTERLDEHRVIEVDDL